MLKGTFLCPRIVINFRLVPNLFPLVNTKKTVVASSPVVSPPPLASSRRGIGPLRGATQSIFPVHCPRLSRVFSPIFFFIFLLLQIYYGHYGHYGHIETY